MEDILSNFIGFTMLTAVIYLFKATIQVIAKTKELRKKQSDGVNDETLSPPPSLPLTEETLSPPPSLPLTEEEKELIERDRKEMILFTRVIIAAIIAVAICIAIAFFAA